MIHTDWEREYQDEFICPKCEQAKLRLGNVKKEKRTFNCPSCKRITLSSINLARRSFYLDSRLKDECIDWKKDYQGEFTCPICNTLGMSVMGINKSGKRRFRCSNCKKNQESSHSINIQAVADPVNPGVIWYTNHLIKDFICPKCQSRDLYFDSIDKYRKKRFKCHTCKHVQQDLFHLNTRNLSRFSETSIPLQEFNWSDDRWDLRTINSNFDVRDNQYYITDFTKDFL
jgi:transcription elongation factor Elf1